MLAKNDYFQSSLEDQAYFLTEVAEATRTGVYSANFSRNKFYIDAIGKSILDLPADYTPTINEATYLFHHSKDARDLIKVCIQGEKFERDLIMSSFNDQEIWMRFTGKPRFDLDGNMIGVRGVFTSIDKYVREKQQVEHHNQIIEGQQERLLHFAHVVSHNLRSQTSNLGLTLDLFKNLLEHDERGEVFLSYLEEISDGLNTTLKHLSQTLTVDQEKSMTEVVDIQKVVNRVLQDHTKEIEAAQITIEIDFSEYSEIIYVASFMNHIIETLISNAILYRDRSRPCIIQLCTRKKNDKNLFVVKDNGRGIALNAGKNTIFNSIHSENHLKNSKGMSLFLAKNQIEAMGGDLVVKSCVGIGSSFTVRF